MRLSFFLLFLTSTLFLFNSCNDDVQEKPSENFTVTARISKDPGFLNPVKSSGSTESIINQYIFLPLANYHPQSLQLIPVLLESIPEGIIDESDAFPGTVRFDCIIKKEAIWENGTDITGYDYLFTIKTILLDHLKVNPSLKSLFTQMQSVEINPKDPKHFSIYVNKDYFLAKELALFSEVLPEHIYDQAKTLRQFDIVKMHEKESEILSDSLQKFVDFFNHADCGRKIVKGSGPYYLEEWQTNQKLLLNRIENYWGNDFPNNPYLNAYPESIIFSVIPNDNSAITALKSENIDLLYRLDGVNYSKLIQEAKLKEKLDFYNPAQLRYYYVGINNHSPFFNDKRARRALAHLMDLDAFIQNQENGHGVRLQGPIHPIRTYFNDSLQPIPPDPEKAKALLKDAGWVDSNQNGTIDKVIDGQLTEFKPVVLITGRSFSKNMALTLKERASEVGIEMEIITKSSKLIRSEIANRNFDLYPTGLNIGLYPEDLYQSWHSSNDYPGGRNRFGFSHPEVDQLIEEIRITNDSTKLDELYRNVQAKIYEEQGQLFLYAPTNNIAVNKRLTPEITVKKHGFFLNAFKLKS